MPDVRILNEQLDLLFQFWNGEITEEAFDQRRNFYISEETDREMQRDRFY